MAETTLRPLESLPRTELPWLTLHDHFVATVGANAGRGKPLGALLVLADATFAPRSRFPLHPHADMEILSIVLDGQLSHHGDQAHGAVMGPRTAQLISARDGIFHAEGNDTDAPTRMLQIWLRPTRLGGRPEYHQHEFPARGRHVIAGPGGMPLCCDARVTWLDLEAGQEARVTVERGRLGYVMALDAKVVTSGGTLGVGEGLEVLSTDSGAVTARPALDGSAASLLLVDVAAE